MTMRSCVIEKITAVKQHKHLINSKYTVVIKMSLQDVLNNKSFPAFGKIRHFEDNVSVQAASYYLLGIKTLIYDGIITHNTAAMRELSGEY